MDFLSQFYRASAKDLASGSSTWLRRYFRTVAIPAAAAASISAQDTDFVGADVVRWISQVVVFWQPGAAITSRSCVLWSSDAGGTIQGVLAGLDARTPVAAANDRDTIQTAFPMFEGDVLNAAAEFSGGAAANQFTAYVTGWEFPRGTLQR